MAAKFILLLTASVLVASSFASPAKTRDYTNCNSQWGDVLLYQGSVERPSKLMQVISFDLPVSTTSATIHCITAINSKPSSPAADVKVTTGGVGYNYVTLHFTSGRNHGIHYNVTISGR